MIEREFKIRNALKYLDLTETEITVYLGLLQTGNIPASMLAKRLNFNRSTTRYTLEKLHQKELVIQYEKNNTFYFVVENLEKILQIFKQEKAVINKKEKVIGDVLNDLKNLQNAHANMPKVQFFEGVNEVKKSLFDIIKDTKKGGQLIEYVSPMHFDTEQKQESCAMQKEIKIVVDIFMTERLKKNITLDLSNAYLIDHTVMEYMHDFMHDYETHGGHCQQVGDAIHTFSDHDLAARLMTADERKK